MAARVLIVDDHPVVRNGLEALLGSLGVEVVGLCQDGESAVRETQLLRPDVVLMDLQMPGIGGVEATRRLAASMPGVAVLVLTMHDDDATVLTAMRAGARGYLLKGATQEEIRAAIDAVRAGQVIFGPGVAAQVLGFFADAKPAPVTAFPELTDREREILDLLASGRRTAAIAQALFLSPKTVSNHLTSIFDKLQVPGRGEAIVRARDGGLGR